jgi:dTDP-glucose pyrophosphorylase
MINYRAHLVIDGTSIREALERFNILGSDAILIVVTEDDKLIGSLTDGDVRRGMLSGGNIDDNINGIIQKDPKFIRKNDRNIYEIIKFRIDNFRIIPVVDEDDKVINIINFKYMRSYLPIDVIIMAGGRGQRLSPLTDDTPKPLLRIGGKPIVRYNVDRLAFYGVDDFWFSVKYLGDQIVDYFTDEKEFNRSINYIWEEYPMGTIGAVSKINNFKHEHILVSNSDILTNLDYELFYLDFLEKDADFSIVTIPYRVEVPYAVLETKNSSVMGFKEKPTYTYYSNAGIYLVKRDMLDYIPKDEYFNATDLIEKLIKENKKVISYPFSDYWLDIGKHDDFIKANQDIKNIKF